MFYPCTDLLVFFFQQPLKKKKIKLEPCWDAQSNPLPRQGSLCAAKPNGWVAIFFRASSSSHPSPGGGTMQTQRLGCCSGLWLMHMQVGEYNISFQFSEPLGSWEPGIQPLSSNTGAPQACWSSTAQQLGVGSCSAGSICCALGKEVGESAATTWNAVPISSFPCPTEALSLYLLTAATLKEDPQVLLVDDRPPSLPTSAVGSLQTSGVGVKFCEALCFHFPSVPSDLEKYE